MPAHRGGPERRNQICPKLEALCRSASSRTRQSQSQPTGLQRPIRTEEAAACAGAPALDVPDSGSSRLALQPALPLRHPTPPRARTGACARAGAPWLAHAGMRTSVRARARMCMQSGLRCKYGGSLGAKSVFKKDRACALGREAADA